MDYHGCVWLTPCYSLRSDKPVVEFAWLPLPASRALTTAIALGKKRPPDAFYPASRNDAERGKGLREVCAATEDFIFLLARTTKCCRGRFFLATLREVCSAMIR